MFSCRMMLGYYSCARLAELLDSPPRLQETVDEARVPQQPVNWTETLAYVRAKVFVLARRYVYLPVRTILQRSWMLPLLKRPLHLQLRHRIHRDRQHLQNFRRLCLWMMMMMMMMTIDVYLTHVGHQHMVLMIKSSSTLAYCNT